MGTIVHPAVEITTCDMCGKVKESKDYKLWSLSGTIRMTCEGLDFQGSAVGPGENMKWIFCNRCYNEISERVRWCIMNPLKEEGEG